MAHRCDFCRSPCGYHDLPAVLLPSTVVLCLHCYQLRVDYTEEHDAAGWISSEDEPEDSSEERSRWGSDEEGGNEPEPEPDPEPEPNPKRQRRK